LGYWQRFHSVHRKPKLMHLPFKRLSLWQP
jgi:hypothetical protein